MSKSSSSRQVHLPSEGAELGFRLWLAASGGIIFGSGRAALLDRVRELGSLHKAAGELGMSYRAAWGRIKRSEKALGQSLLHREPGHKGFVLTAFALELLQGFRLWQAEVETFARQRAKVLLPEAVRPGPSGPNKDLAEDLCELDGLESE